MSLLDYLRSYGRAANTVAVKDAQAEPDQSDGQGFTPFEGLSPRQVWEANAQKGLYAQQAGGVWDQFEAGRSSDSFPWPTDSQGAMLPLQRGALSGVPGAGETDHRGGD